jgi:integrase
MTIHDLRHTTASLTVSAGANVKAVQRMLGHASAAMTLDVYADLFNDDLDDVAHRLDEAASVALNDVAAPSHAEVSSVTTTDLSGPR